MNDIKCHVDGAVHLQGYASISNLFERSQEQRLIHTSRITSAEVKLVNFIALYNLSFQAMTIFQVNFHLFPDSAISADFACR